MTTIRVQKAANGAGVGVFATRPIAAGEIVLEEAAPLVSLVPTPEENQRLWDETILTKNKTTASLKNDDSERTWTDAIQVPDSMPKHCRGTFKSMVQAGACFLLRRPSVDLNERLLALYHPTPSQYQPHEEEVLKIAQQARDYLVKIAKHGSPLHSALAHDNSVLLEILLIYSCNAFEGGHVYETASRINHSCNPNLIVQSSQDGIRLRAATAIDPNDECTISYLTQGFLHAERRVRQAQLQHTKHFLCQCTHCQKGNDVPAAIPCPPCHPRQPPGGVSLMEDVQYDDEHTVHYAHPTPNVYTCNHCKTEFQKDGGPYAKTLQVVESVTDKMVDYLQQPLPEDEQLQADLDEEHIRLASTVLGAAHWTTNLLLLRHLDRNLKQLFSEMILNGTEPDLSEVAESIDTLERLCRFVDGLELHMCRGHALSDVIVGVARTLVSLGDTKSQKYAAEWLAKIEDYVQQFETEGMKKVVSSLQVAWKQEGNQDEPIIVEDPNDGARDKKRTKTA